MEGRRPPEGLVARLRAFGAISGFWSYPTADPTRGATALSSSRGVCGTWSHAALLLVWAATYFHTPTACGRMPRSAAARPAPPLDALQRPVEREAVVYPAMLPRFGDTGNSLMARVRKSHPDAGGQFSITSGLDGPARSSSECQIRPSNAGLDKHSRRHDGVDQLSQSFG